MEPKNHLYIICILLITLAIGTSTLYFSYSTYKEETEITRNVEKVNAKIISTEMEKTNNGYEPEITYSYIIDGKKYKSSNYKPKLVSDTVSKSKADQIMQRYKVGETKEVYVHREKNIDSYIRKPSLTQLLGLAVDNISIFAIGSLVILLGFFICKLMYSIKKKETKTKKVY